MPQPASFPGPRSPPPSRRAASTRPPAGGLVLARVLAAYNQDVENIFLPASLRSPLSFWKSQNPTGSQKVGWTRCCVTVKEMVDYNAPQRDRIQISKERGRSLVQQPSAGKVTAGSASDSFMPTSFWQTQYEETPVGWKPKWEKQKNGKMG